MLRHSIPRNDKRVFAFTLAEVLITLTIIGVIAALTIPTLMKNYQRHQLKSGFKTTYATAANAVLKAKTELGVSNFNDYLDTAENRQVVFDTILKQFKIIKSIDLDTYKFKPYKVYDAKITQWSPMVYANIQYILNNGSGISVYVFFSDFSIVIDTNGNGKGPNRMGYDTFFFGINRKDGILKPIAPYKDYDPIYGNNDEDFSYKGTGKYCSANGAPNNNFNGWHCAYYAQIDKNPDDPTKGYWESLE